MRPSTKGENPFNKMMVVDLIIATDAPLLPHQLKRLLAKRATIDGSHRQHGREMVPVIFSLRSLQPTPALLTVTKRDYRIFKFFPTTTLSSAISSALQTEEAIINARWPQKP